MATQELLNNNDHRDLKIITKRSADLGEDVSYVYTFPLEFKSIQAHYPIVFRKDTTTAAALFPVALLGFEDGENLFLEHEQWNANYVPCMFERQPFSIARQSVNIDGEKSLQSAVCIDVASPRVNKTEGQSIFLEFGGNSAYLEKVVAMLEAIEFGNEHNQKFVAQLRELDLLESLSVEVELKNGSQHSLFGYYTINEDKLAQLNGASLEKLHANGFLQFIYMIIASQVHFRDLIELKNKKITAAQQ
jgi:hypothetical protein